jgi:2-succinyl-5-enolpyruvyl-6-hydroxy-3-cyclohexene-1-carboxylate synthase
MKETNASFSYRLALILLRQLVASGVQTLVASPGFRNSPLLLAAHRLPELEVLSAVDERGGAFLALGAAKASRAPVAVLCTSGTAVANFFPAVLEAHYSGVPLIVLSADRPAELVGTGANQCMDQTKIFGTHVRFYADIIGTDAGPSAERHVAYSAGRAVAKALAPQMGPVHLNIRFREPFLPEAEAAQVVDLEEARPQKWKFLSSASGPAKEQLSAIADLLAAARRPLIATGPETFSPAVKQALLDLASSRGIPVLAEASGGLGFPAMPVLAQRCDPVFEAILAERVPPPDLLLRVGAPVTGKGLPALLRAHPIPLVVFEEWGETREPDLNPTIFIEGGIEGWIKALRDTSGGQVDMPWAERIWELDRSLDSKLTEHLAACPPFTEWHFHRALGDLVADGSSLFLGNSMPIRDFNSVFPRVGKHLRVFSNRGLSGIDGLLASAAGIAKGGARDTHAVIGDLSTLHDLSSLSLLAALKHKVSLTLWITNNRGGEIFRYVATAKAGGQEDWFTTPQSFDLAALAKSFQLSYGRVQSQEELAGLDPGAFAGPGVRLIEVMVEPSPNFEIRKTFRPFA